MDVDAFYRVWGAEVHSGKARHAAIAGLVTGTRVLDVGCGTGDLLLILQERRIADLMGVDISQVALEMARERGVRAVLACGDGVVPGPWDTIVLAQVLEHVADDVGMVRAAGENLAAGGRLIVSVPREDRVEDNFHVREYTEGSLRELLGMVGEPVLHRWEGEADRLVMWVER